MLHPDRKTEEGDTDRRRRRGVGGSRNGTGSLGAAPTI